MIIVVGNNQSLYDIAVFYTGDATKAFDIALENDLQVDEVLTPGMELEYSGVVNTKMTMFLAVEPEPATQLTTEHDHDQIFDFVFDKFFE